MASQPIEPTSEEKISSSSPETQNVKQLINESLAVYLSREFGNIKNDPRYQRQIHSGALMVFDDDNLFHLRRALDGSWLEWRILSYISLQTANLGNKLPSAFLSSYLDQEFQTIQNDPVYRTNINNGRLAVLPRNRIFHMQDALDGSYLEWRILSYNALRSHWIPTA